METTESATPPHRPMPLDCAETPALRAGVSRRAFHTRRIPEGRASPIQVATHTRGAPPEKRPSRVVARRVPLAAAVLWLLTSGTALAADAFLAAPTHLDFGQVSLGTTSPEQVITITNVSGVALRFRGTGGAAGLFGGSQNCEQTILEPGESCQYSYAFTPQDPGPVTGSTDGTFQGEPPAGGQPTPEQGFVFTFEGIGVAAPPMLPFASFDVLVVEAHSPRETFSVSALLRLGAGSNGIDPTTEAVTLIAGQYSVTIPGGSFRRRRDGTFVFTSPALTAAIRPLRGSRFAFASAVNGGLPGTDPVGVSITIGDDGGNAASVEPVTVGP